jgi:predicted DNA-binding protein
MPGEIGRPLSVHGSRYEFKMEHDTKERLEDLAETLGIPLAEAVRIVLRAGLPKVKAAAR